jgi:DNA-binding MarR family transcriptional regulator
MGGLVTQRRSLEVAVADLMQGIGLLIRRMRAEVGGDGLSMTETSVIGRLAKGGPATSADLARSELVKPQSMGSTVAGLEEQGLIKRKPHPTDGRQIYVELTEKGMETWKSRRAAKHSKLAAAIAELDKQDQEILFKAGEILKKIAGN